jgi:thioesterase domain-containing protein
MKTSSSTTIFFPGIGGEIPVLGDLDIGDGNLSLEPIGYPEWWRSLPASEFRAEALMADFEAQIAAKAPQGPLQIVGYSIGGHFGYVAALHLKAAGREITGFCILDSFMIGSVTPLAGWQRRVRAEVMTIIRTRPSRELILFVRSKFWRVLLRLARDRLAHLLGRPGFARLVAQIAALDKVLYSELTMHVFMRKVAPWIQALDRDPLPLAVPTVLLRTRENSEHDQAWRRRCPNLEVIEISGQHQSLFGPENMSALRAAYATAMRKLTEYNLSHPI